MAKIFKYNAFYRSLNTLIYLLLISKILKNTIPSYESSSVFLLFHLHTLYTQLCRITRVAQVLPRLLAPVFATTSLNTYYHNFCIWLNFTTTVAFLIPVKLIGHTFVHCLKPFTAAIWWGVFIPHVVDPSLKSTRDNKHTFVYT